jgi:hypothetical protein
MVVLDPEKIVFLFGSVPDGVDVDDPSQREALLAPADEPDSTARMQGLVRAALANQIAEEDPPETWQTARRLLALGLDREKVMREMALVMSAQIAAAAGPEKRVFDTEEYLRALAELPLPRVEDIREALVELARAHHPLDPDELDQMVAERFHRRPDDPILQRLLDAVLDQLVIEGVVDFLADDRVVHLPDLTSNVVLTHRLAEEEVAGGPVDAAVDLAPFARRPEMRLKGGEIMRSGRRWHLPAGALGDLAVGQMVTVSVAADGLVRMEPLDAQPAVDPALVERFRRAYDEVVEEGEVPALVEEIVWELLAEDRTLFDHPQPPLTDLCREAGLEVRGAMAAHEEGLWENQRELQQLQRAWEEFENDQQSRDAALSILLLARQPNPGRADLKRALNSLADEQIAGFAVEELMAGDPPDEDQVASVQEFASALIRAAGEGMPKIVAHWFAALIAEQAGDVLVADAHLQVALNAGRDWPPVLDRAAWYASDRGDAPGALGLLRRMPDPPLHALVTLGEFEETAQPDIGRNEPCWCGSGRKFKNCHLRQPQGHPLPERVGWLCFKAAWFLEHQRREALDEVLDLAEIRVGNPDDRAAVTKALGDPLLMDLVLTERGWFQDFVEVRGSLLPEDELLLAQSWILVDRSVYEVESVWPRTGLTVRDLATGERLEVRERTFSLKAQKGWMICARAVPDGETNQFVGGIFAVPPGAEERVLDMCAEGDTEALAAWVGALERPPRMTTREGEEMVGCNLVWLAEDAEEARRALDDHYDREGDAWIERHELDRGQGVVRAQIGMEGDRLTVDTLSEERMDRVIDFLASRVPGRLVSDSREPVGPGTGTPDSSRVGGFEDLDPESMAEAVAQIQEQMEDRWMDEPVPALAGLTPREAAADPTRREQLERLLASFEQMDPGRWGSGPKRCQPPGGFPITRCERWTTSGRSSIEAPSPRSGYGNAGCRI